MRAWSARHPFIAMTIMVALFVAGYGLIFRQIYAGGWFAVVLAAWLVLEPIAQRAWKRRRQ